MQGCVWMEGRDGTRQGHPFFDVFGWESQGMEPSQIRNIPCRSGTKRSAKNGRTDPSPFHARVLPASRANNAGTPRHCLPLCLTPSPPHRTPSHQAPPVFPTRPSRSSLAVPRHAPGAWRCPSTCRPRLRRPGADSATGVPSLLLVHPHRPRCRSVPPSDCFPTIPDARLLLHRRLLP